MRRGLAAVDSCKSDGCLLLFVFAGDFLGLPLMSGLTPEQLMDFKKALMSLCDSYGVWIKRNGERREAPSNPIYYYEVELSVKVSPQGSQDLIEAKRR